MKTKLPLFITVLAAALFGMGCSSLDKGLVAYYPFNGNAQDESGNGNHGEIKGAVLAVDRNGKANSSYSFGGDDLIRAKHQDYLNTLPITISIWFNTSDGETDHVGLVGKYLNASWVGYSVHMIKGVLHVDYLTGAPSENSGQIGGVLENCPKSKFIADGKWHHMVCTVDSDNGILFVDGEQVSVKPWVGKSGVPITSWPLDIGLREDSRPEVKAVMMYFKGFLDDVRIYNRALSAEEVKSLYDLEKPKTK